MEYDAVGFKLKYVAPLIKAFGNEPSYQRDGSFPCRYRNVTANENIRAGRNAEVAFVRLWYPADHVRFNPSDRIQLLDQTYTIEHVPFYSTPVYEAYIDVRKLDI
jgi:hypothetical protein